MRIRASKICIILIASIAIINAQVWLVQTLFPQKEEKRKILGYTLFMGWWVASLLLLFSYIIQPWLATLSQTIFSTSSLTILSNTTADTRGYSLFILLGGVVLSLLLASKKQLRPVFFVSSATVLALITGIGEYLLAGTGLWLVVLKATGEEVLKTSSAQSLTAHTTVFKSDVIIMSILAGFGFALFENLTYFIASGSLWAFIARSLTTSLLHGIFTGTIWYMLRKHNTQSYLGYIYAYILGLWLHAIYNISMVYIPVIGWVTFVIGGYFLLTYFLYKSDRLYMK